MEDYEKIVKRSRDAFLAEKTKPLEFRRKQLKALLKMIEENESKIVDALHKDLRKAKQESMTMEIDLIKNDILSALANLESWAKDRSVEKNLITLLETCFVHKEPFGVVLVMSAWNYPIQLALGPFVGALAAGNCVVLKPSEISSATADLLAELIPDYLDQECYHVICGGVPETTEMLKVRWDYVFYTGSAPVGKLVRGAVNEYLTPVTLELGGKSPVYLDNSCDMLVAARRMLWGKTVNLGQTCVAPDYLLCSKEVQDKFLVAAKQVLDEWYGEEPRLSDSLGRIVTDRHFKRIENLLKSGGTVAIGGRMYSNEKFIEPTVVINVKTTDPLMQEEIFGPVLPILNVDSPEEAIQFIKSREKPLTMYVFSTKKAVVDKFIKQTSSGSFCANDTIIHLGVESLPFGGVGMSGMGQYHGKYSFDTFSHDKAVLVRNYFPITEKLGTARYPPYSDSKIRQMRPLLKRRQFIKMTFLAYIATFALGVATTCAVHYAIKSMGMDDGN